MSEEHQSDKSEPEPERYQRPETEQYPRFGRLLIVLAVVTIALFLATWASVYFLDT